MKRLKIILLVILVLFLLRGNIFRLMITYHPIEEQPSYPISAKNLAELVENKPISADAESIVKQTLRLTAGQLRFTSGKNFTDPNQLFYSKSANCVGYAAFFNTTCQALLHKAKLETRFRVKHLRGKLTLHGLDLHQLTDSPYFHDHDFNVLEDLQTGEKVYVDASTFDVLGIGLVSGK
jgi:hypothetical protein